MTLAYDPVDVAVTALRTTLLTIPDVVAIVGSSIYWEDVRNDEVRPPYMVISRRMGGFENKTQANAVDLDMTIIGYTADKLVASALQIALRNLHYLDLVVTDFTNVKPYGGIQQTAPHYRKDSAQHIPLYEVGGIYRVRFIINDII